MLNSKLVTRGAIRIHPTLSFVVTLLAKGLFFFWLGMYVIEAWLFDINPTFIKVAGTSFSISFYEYITLFDLGRFFWSGLAVLMVGALLYAFSMYRYIPIALAAFAVAFYYEIVKSTTLMAFYKDTYACHTSISHGVYQYVCPLEGMVTGHPNIPLQGNVVALIALAIAIVSFGGSRGRAGIREAIVETIILASAILTLFEIGIYYFEGYFFAQQVTDYQGVLHLSWFTNEKLLMGSAVVLVIASSIRIVMGLYSQRGSASPAVKENKLTLSR